MSKPLFSIITVTLNNVAGLKKTYDSLHHQTSQDFEWIIIDGASNDSTIEFLNTQNIPHISEKDSGIYDAMNKGIARANGTYILFLNAGDSLADSETLQKITQKTDNQDYDFIYGDSLEELGDTQTYKRAREHHKINQGMFTHHQAMIYNSKLIQNMRYDESYKIASDYDFTRRALQNATRPFYIDIPICLFESGGISQQQVLKGRREQFDIRCAHQVPLYKNISIFIAQTLIYKLRLICPKIYWFLKR